MEGYSNIFWDFDGVIKDSMIVKSEAFEKLFLPFGRRVAKNIREHHEANGGMSRYDKLPIYFGLSGITKSEELISKYEKKFSSLVKQRVIDSQWVDGVNDYLVNNHNRQNFFLVTATPQHEIESILFEIEIFKFFKRVVGSPTTKKMPLKC
jgi:beta-phosphoglucomutase-like phosphatase (HAD superfamily)